MSDPSAEPLFSPFDAWDPLHEPSWPNEHWSTANVGEALPGVLTPLGLDAVGHDHRTGHAPDDGGHGGPAQATRPSQPDGVRGPHHPHVLRPGRAVGRPAGPPRRLHARHHRPAGGGRRLRRGAGLDHFKPTLKRLPFISVGLPKEHFTISKQAPGRGVGDRGLVAASRPRGSPALDYADAVAAFERRHEALQLQRPPPGDGAVLRRAADVRRPHPPVGQDRRRRRHRPVRRLRRRARDAGGGRPVALLPG